MVKLLVTVVIVTFHVSLIYAQSLSPVVISPAGGIDHLHDISLEWTLGELAVATYMSDGQMLTEGFHQPLLSAERIEVPDIEVEDALKVRIAPNPVKYTLDVEISDPQNRVLEMQIIDAQGRLVEHMRIDAYVRNYKIDMIDYASGFYVLRILDPASRILLDAFKVSKID